MDRFKKTFLNANKLALAISLAVIADSASAALEEIVVTASKRAESTQTSALSITAIGEQEIEARGAVDFFDFAPSIPNLAFGAATDGVLSGRSLSIRGIQGANTTGVYIDDTPIRESLDPRILELQRIEVLRGPQGTLYGARSLGGTIRFISKRAQAGETFGKVRAGLSRTDESGDLNYFVSGNYNIPFGESAALFLSGFYEDEGGVFDRAVGTIADHQERPATLNGPANLVMEDVDGRSTLAFQASLLLNPSENFFIEPRILYQKVDLDGFPLADIEPENFVQNRDFNDAEGGEDEWALVSLNLNYETSYGTFTSATSYFDQEVFETEASGEFVNFLQSIPLNAFFKPISDELTSAVVNAGFAADTDSIFSLAGVNPSSSPIFQQQVFETTVQELRFVSDFDGYYNVVVGLFYQDTTDEQNFIPQSIATNLNANVQAAFDRIGFDDSSMETFPFTNSLIFTAIAPTEIEELGIFGEVTFDINERLSLLLGARWFDTEVSFVQRRAGLAAGVPLPAGQTLADVDAQGGAQQEDGVNLKASIEYEASDSLYIYASVAEGFRLGGANSVIPTTLGCPENLQALGVQDVDTGSFESDDLISYEAGFKTDLSDSVRINATAFFIDFDNIQQSVQLQCGFQFVGNFGSAESKGFELEALFQPGENLALALNLGYTDAEFTETVTGVAIAGDALQFVPELTLSANLDYSVADAFRGMDFFTRVDLSYTDDSISRVNSEVRNRDAYEQVGLRFGLRDEKYTFTAFMRNLTDEIANLADNRSIAAETPGRPRFVVSRPRTIGAEFSFSF